MMRKRHTTENPKGTTETKPQKETSTDREKASEQLVKSKQEKDFKGWQGKDRQKIKTQRLCINCAIPDCFYQNKKRKQGEKRNCKVEKNTIKKFDQ